MSRASIFTLAVVVGFTLGLGASTAKDRLAPPEPTERAVYCPLGTSDPECVEARRRYERGELAESRPHP